MHSFNKIFILSLNAELRDQLHFRDMQNVRTLVEREAQNTSNKLLDSLSDKAQNFDGSSGVFNSPSSK